MTKGDLSLVRKWYRAEANVVPLEGGTKRPIGNWKQWQSSRQSEEEFDAFPWSDASGAAVINGPGDWHSIDVDECDDKSLVDDLLSEMGLSSDYQWIVQSGGGFHIWFHGAEQSDHTVKKFDSADPRCKQIELRWAGSYTAVPPSKHPSGDRYRFLDEPDSAPADLRAEQVMEAIKTFTGGIRLTPTEKATTDPAQSPWDGDPEVVEDALRHLADSYDVPPGYEQWLKISSAVVDGIGEARGVELLERHLPPIDDDGDDYRKKDGQWLDDIRVGTLFHIAKENGWMPPWKSSPASGDESDATEDENTDGSSDFPAPIAASDVEPETISWFWDDYVAEGMVHLLDGDPGTGKSTFLLSLAASFSQGKTPDGQLLPTPINTLYISGEDPAETVLVPRFKAADGCLEHLHLYGASRAGALTFPDALPEIERQIRKHTAKFCVIDPFFSLLNRGYSKNAEQDVREVLSAVTKVAKDTNCAFFLVRHFNKKEDSSALYRGGGSIGITAQARLAYAFLPDPKDDSRRILAWEKNNISRKDRTDALAFEMKSAETDVGEQPRLKFQCEESRSVEELMNGSRGRPPEQKNRAKALIKDALENVDRKPAGDMYDLIEGEEISKSTFQRAAEELGVEKKNDSGTWYWRVTDGVSLSSNHAIAAV
jgi:hypothetical protein